jgi:hypothetical protein
MGGILMNYELKLLEDERRQLEIIVNDWPAAYGDHIGPQYDEAFKDRKRKLNDINEAIEKLKG